MSLPHRLGLLHQPLATCPCEGDAGVRLACARARMTQAAPQALLVAR